MVPTTSFIAMIVTLLICFLVPIGLLIIVRLKSKNVTGAFFAGAAAFYISQMLIRLPIIQLLLPKFKWYTAFAENNVLLFIVLLSLSAALFEETARYLAFQLLLKDRQVWKCGITFGIGHGGAEAILLIGMTYVNNIVISLMINQNRLEQFLQGKIDAGTMGSIVKSLTETKPSLFLAAGVERSLVIVVHIALSVLVLEGIVRNRRLFFYILAIAGHTALNTVSGWLGYLKVHFWLVELSIALFAIAGIIYIITSKKRFGDKIDAVNEAAKALEDGY